MFQTKTLLAVLTSSAVGVCASAGTLTISQTAPTVDGDDVRNVASGATLKWFADVEAPAGQTFTPTSSGNLMSFTTRIGPNHSNEGDANPESIMLRFGTVSGTPGVDWAFNETHSETVEWTEDMVANDYLTWSFDTPQAVSAGTEYAVITEATAMGNWQNGIPYLARSNGSSYAGGHMINRGTPSTGSDLDFHADIVIPEPSSLALLGLGGLLIARRRRS